MARWFIRCSDCLAVGAVDLPAGAIPEKGLCPCGGTTERMGRVVRQRLQDVTAETPCDARCTNARGPSCDCRCHGEHHGSGALVAVYRDAGPLPRYMLTPNAERAKVYRAALHEAECSGHYGAANRARMARTHAGRMKILAPWEEEV